MVSWRCFYIAVKKIPRLIVDGYTNAQIGQRYSNLLVHYPGSVIIITLFSSLLFPAICLYFNPLQVTQNPELGFDTRGTLYSGARLAWDNVSWSLMSGNRLSVPQNRTRVKRSWAEQLLNTFGQVPCYEVAIPAMDFLSQFVVEVDSLDSLFDYDYLEMLCSVHMYLAKQLSVFDHMTPYRNIWSLPNYLSCLSPNLLANCSFMAATDLQQIRQTVDLCRRHRDEIIRCRKKCVIDCEPCDNVPQNCSSQIVFDLFYRILPRDLTVRPLHLNAFLPIFTLSAYRTRGFYNVSAVHYLDIQNALHQFAKQNPKFVLKGLSMDIKRDILYDGARRDSLLALLAAFCVFGAVFAYSLNILFCVAVALMLFLSVLLALSVYALFSDQFPLLNLVVFVLLLAIGSDDAFVLLNSFPVGQVNLVTVHQCLAHTMSTMLLTSASTAVPFFANILSSVIVFRCFGLFAGLTLIFNYLLEISFLPAVLIVQSKSSSFCYCCCSLTNWRSFPQLSYLMREILPQVIITGRHIWLCSLTIVMGLASYNVISNLRFPSYNPLQLFVGSNEHEWYDNNAEAKFEFVENKLGIPITVRLVWGLGTRHSSSLFRPDQLSDVIRDSRFHLSNITHMKALADSLSRYRQLGFVDHPSGFWPERYLDWSRSLDCTGIAVTSSVCCNYLRSDYNQSDTDYCMRLSTMQLYTQYNDTPIFDNQTFELIGYTAMLPTKLVYSYRYSNLSTIFQQLQTSFDNQKGGWFTTEWTLMSVWYDLLRSIIADCRQSLVLSLLVVTALAIVHLNWKSPMALVTIVYIVLVTVGVVVGLGWIIGVLEAVILVLIVGLSFDFTLHYGASVPVNGCARHRVQLAAQKSAVPVTLAAMSSVVAGASMLFAETHAFYQVGVFLMVSASVSWLYATFFFLPLLTFTLRSGNSCALCLKKTIDSSLKEKLTVL